jgi:tetratricopeptide (TPR) repeat protein/predicted Ser/Thr protein kinase
MTTPSGGGPSSSSGVHAATLADNHDAELHVAEPAARVGVTRLGRHLLLDLLGEGGMGMVYAAYDVELDRKVAIKLLRSHEHEQARRRMLREAQAMARISHPNVAQVYEIGVHDEQVFLVMELIDGVTLKTWLGQHPRTRRELLATFIAAGNGLVAAHEQGVVHRDFKPDNVMIRRDGRVLVLDFGLARGQEREQELSSPDPTAPALERAGVFELPLTHANTILGTPNYMAPEQFAGRETDARTDQFSFCVALWEALFGQQPFGGVTLAQRSLAVSEGRLIEPERSDVPTWLRGVLERGLSVAPEHRWPTMLELLAALTRDPTRRRRARMLAAGLFVLVGVGVSAALAWPAHERRATISECERAGRVIEADWNEAIEATLASTFAASGARFAPSVWTHTRPWIDDYARSWASLRTQTCLETKLEHTRSQASHDAIVECLDARRATFAGLLAAWAEPNSRTVLRATQAAANLEPLSICTSELLAARAQPPEALRPAVADLRSQIDRVEALRSAGEYDVVLTQALEIRAQADALSWRPLQAEAWFSLANLQSNLGKFDEARASHEQAVFHAAAGGDDMTMLLAATELTYTVGYDLAQHEQGQMWGTLGESLIERLGLAGSLREAAVLGVLAGVSTTRGDYDDALKKFRRALEIKQAILGAEHPAVAVTINSIGVVLFNQGSSDDALEHFRRSLSIEQATLGPEHPYVAYSLNNLAAALQQLGRYDEALEYHRLALALREGALGPDNPDVATSLANIGELLGKRGQYEQAMQLQLRALAIFEAALGPEHPEVAMTLLGIAELATNQGRYASAAEHLRRALVILEAALGPEHPEVVKAREQLAEVEAKLLVSGP